MDMFVALILAVVQGISEWFPISGSGHLVLFSKLLGVDNSIQFDVALHFGTLMAVFVYFGKDIVDILEDLLKGRWGSKNARMGGLLVIATIPAAVVGYFLNDIIDSIFSSLWVVAVCFGITGLFLLIASLDFNLRRRNMGWKEAVGVGVAQAFAILPGVSRSGATISSGLLLGLDEKQAVRFSFLMSIPVIFGAGILKIGTGRLSPELIWASLVAFAVGLVTIHFLLKILVNSRKNLRWFALYVLLLAFGMAVYLLIR